LESADPFKELKPYKSELEPKFHQDLFIDFTSNHIDKGDYKFIWGAVPRSGKSYMIGGLIAKRRPKNVLIILGAVSETHSQFNKMFEDYKGSFGDYNIVDVSEKGNFDNIDLQKKGVQNIIIVSQQKLWNKKNKEDKELRLHANLDAMLKDKDKMIFYDEIHQGAGPNSESQNDILSKYVVEDGEKLDFPFIMVTATYLKPMLKYGKLGKTEALILQWTYDMMQNMKDIVKERTQEMMESELLSDKNKEIGKEKAKLFKVLLEQYQKKGYTLYDLQREYVKEPELAIICPNLNEVDETYSDNTIHTGLNIRDIFDIKKITIEQQRGGIEKLLSHIKNNIYGSGPLIEQGFNVLNRRHSQLWFLPPNMPGKKKDEQLEDVGVVEPLMRVLSEELLKNPFFRDNFCFVLMHSKSLKDKRIGNKYADIVNRPEYDTLDIADIHKLNIKESIEKSNGRLCFTPVCLSSNDGDKECLRKEECESYKNKRSLIILTAGKLRLGVSLPCVDLALHMDPVKSSDPIYQSMFRVLTPAPNKKKGFFVDLLPSRMIQFFYHYENSVNSNKENRLPEARLARMRQLLYSHNLNGINMNDSTEEYIDAYSGLIESLGLTNVDTMIQKTIEYKVNEENAQSVIEKMFSTKEIKKYMSRIKVKNIKTKKDGPDKIKKILIDRVGEIEPTEEGDDEISSTPILPSAELTEQEKQENLKQLVEYFLNTLAILIFFDDDDQGSDCDKENVVKGLKKIMNKKNVSNPPDTKDSLCEDKSRIMECYFAMSFNLKDADKTTKDDPYLIINKMIEHVNTHIDVFKEIVAKLEKEDHSDLINIYCNIKSSFMAIKTKHHPQNKKSEPCSKNFIEDEKILKIIRDRLTIREDEKNEHGEVFTPPKLVCEIFNALPKNVWSNPDLKWLDPANGIGNFPIIAYYKLMKGLESNKDYEDKNKRSKHIIEKMLYMVELNPVNSRLCKKIFKMIDDKATPNVSTANFLTGEDKWKKDFDGVDRFDVIIGNPPWNEQEGLRQGGYGGKAKLWDKFIENSLKILNKNGYLCFINPAGWRGLGKFHKLWNILSNKQLLYLHIYSKKDGNRLFNVSSRFDLYVLQNKENTKPTDIIDELGEKHEIKVNEWPFLPNYDYKKIHNIMTTEDKGIDVIYDTSYHTQNKEDIKDVKTSEYKYPVVHSINKDGLVFWYSNDKSKGHFGVPKVMLNFNEHQYSYPEQNDYEGKYGMSQITFGIPIKSKKEGDLILKAVETPDFKNIIESTKWGAFQTDYRMFKYFKPDFYKDLLHNSSSPNSQTHKNGKGGSYRKTIKKGLRKRVGPVKTRRRKHKYPTKRTIKRNNSRGKSKTRRKRRY